MFRMAQHHKHRRPCADARRADAWGMGSAGRNVHLVGSAPMASAEDVFRTMSAVLGPRLRRIPDGETGHRIDWVTWLEPVFSGNPAFEPSDEVSRVHENAPSTPRSRRSISPAQPRRPGVRRPPPR